MSDILQYPSIPESTRVRWRDTLHSLCDYTGADSARVIQAWSSETIILAEYSNSARASSPETLTADDPWITVFQDRKLVHLYPDSLTQHQTRTPAGVGSYLGYPLRWTTAVPFGVLDLRSRSGTPFDERAIRLLSQFGQSMDDQLAMLASDWLQARSAGELHAHRERLMLAAEVSGLGVWDYNIDADILHCDSQCYSIYGVNPMESELRTIADFQALVHPDDVERITDNRIDELSVEKQDSRVEFRLIRPSGEIRWITSAARMIPATPGSFNRLVGVVIDITEAKLAEQQLLRTIDSLRQAERLARIGSWSLDLSTGRFGSSEMLYEMNGADPNGPPLTPADLERLLSPPDFQRVQACIAHCVATGEPYGIDATHLRPDGSSFAVHIRGQAIRDVTGSIVGLGGTVQDISEREEARARLEALADNLPSGAIYRLEHDDVHGYRLSYVSAGISSLLGIPAPEIVADRAVYVSRIHLDDFPRYQEGLDRSRLDLSVFDCEFRVYRTDGSMIWMRCRSAPRQTDHGIVWDGIMLDITRERDVSIELQRAKEAAETAERAKSEFLATMSHEIRTPMNTVIGMTRLLMQTSLTAKQRNYLDKVDLSAKALLSIINDVLDYSKIEAGMLVLEDTQFELESVLESVSAVTAMRAEEKGLEIVYSVSPQVPQLMRGDPLRLSQVLTNLVGNAVKFTERGEIVVTAEVCENANLRTQTAKFCQLCIAVRDTGIGIEKQQMGALFRPFSQAEVATTRRYGGTGLGLAICHRLVQLMGGAIEVESEAGVGSTFRFTIAVGVVDECPSVSDRRNSVVLDGVRVLIVDDNASARETLTAMVQAFGMRVDAVSSGLAGLRALRQASDARAPYDIVLMDWRMPGMDGLEVAQRIREEQSLSRIPAVLMVTAYGREEVLRRVEQLGLQGLLIKPVTESLMFNTLLEVLRNAQPPHALYGREQERGRAAAAPHVPSIAGIRVLVVDDNALNREVVTDFLELADVVVYAATNGLEAIHMLEAASFDAVLMDVHMPVMNGIEATTEIRRRPEWVHLPIIAITAQATAEDKAMVLQAGMDDHIAKPIDDKLLYEVLERHTSKAALSTEKGDHESKDSSDERVEPGKNGQLVPENVSASGVVSAAPTHYLNLDTMYERFGHRGERVRRVLDGFLRDFSDAPQALPRLAEASSQEELRDLAHALKGSLGYLGASATASLAEQVEDAARRRNVAGAATLVERLSDDLARLLSEVKAAQVPKPAASPYGNTVPVNTDTLLPKLQALYALIERGDYAAVSILDRLAIDLPMKEYEGYVEQLRRQFDDLELQDALHTLRMLMEELKDSGEGHNRA